MFYFAVQLVNIITKVNNSVEKGMGCMSFFKIFYNKSNGERVSSIAFFLYNQGGMII